MTEKPAEEVKLSNNVTRKLAERKKEAKLDPAFAAQFTTGKVLAMLSSRPGQSGRADGYILEGAEFEVSLLRPFLPWDALWVLGLSHTQPTRPNLTPNLPRLKVLQEANFGRQACQGINSVALTLLMTFSKSIKACRSCRCKAGWRILCALARSVDPRKQNDLAAVVLSGTGVF